MKVLYKLSFIIVLILSSGFNQPDPQTYYENGMASLHRKEYIQAIGEFTNAISLKPDYGDAYFQRARAKDLLGKKMGFFSSELCFDLVSATRHGKFEAVEKIENSCMGECFDLDDAFFEPEVVFCADFHNANLTDLPDGADKLLNIVKLNFPNNKIQSLSEKFTKLSTLVILDGGNNQIKTLSSSIGNLTYLKELNLTKNKIQELPKEIGNLQSLKTLNLRFNLISNLPNSIGQLSNLESLDLAFNKLTSLPAEITNLKKLKALTLVGNNISQKEQSKIKALLPHTTIHFE